MTLRVFFWRRLPIFDAGSSRLVATPMGCMTVSTVESWVYIMLSVQKKLEKTNHRKIVQA